MNEEEKQELKELKKEAKQKNYIRAREKTMMFLRVKDNWRMKLYINNRC